VLLERSQLLLQGFDLRLQDGDVVVFRLELPVLLQQRVVDGVELVVLAPGQRFLQQRTCRYEDTSAAVWQGSRTMSTSMCLRSFRIVVLGSDGSTPKCDVDTLGHKLSLFSSLDIVDATSSTAAASASLLGCGLALRILSTKLDVAGARLSLPSLESCASVLGQILEQDRVVVEEVVAEQTDVSARHQVTRERVGA